MDDPDDFVLEKEGAKLISGQASSTASSRRDDADYEMRCFAAIFKTRKDARGMLRYLRRLHSGTEAVWLTPPPGLSGDAWAHEFADDPEMVNQWITVAWTYGNVFGWCDVSNAHLEGDLSKIDAVARAELFSFAQSQAREIVEAYRSR
ncbi:MAG: hypothetical protein ICV64_12560 [Thermoleophilia bacterium]|nr:hypothetical protein [Thermoleophilia bacterium]